jgi:hypothetical protein
VRRRHELLARMHVHVTGGSQIWHSITGRLLQNRSNVNTRHGIAHRGATCVGVCGGVGGWVCGCVGAVLCVCVRLSLSLSRILSVVHPTDPSSSLDLFLLGPPSSLPEEV